MKIYFYIASSMNGCIDAADGNSDWVSEADNQSFLSTCRRVGAVIMGRKTYEVLSPNDLPLETGNHIVLTSQNLTSNNPTVTFTNEGPIGAINILKNKGCKEVVVIGGNQTWTSFMKDGLVDEIFLDIEPLALGNGKALFQGADFNIQLELLATKPLSPQTLHLHYKIKK